MTAFHLGSGACKTADPSPALKPRKTANVRTQELWKETARRTQTPLKVEATRWKGGEFKKSESKRSGGRGRKGKEKQEEGEVQKKEMVEEVQRAYHIFVYDKNEERTELFSMGMKRDQKKKQKQKQSNTLQS